MDWKLLLAPLLALAGALIGSLVSPFITAGRARALWLLQQQGAVYTDAVSFARSCDDEAKTRGDPEYHYENPFPWVPEGVGLWSVDTRMRLYAQSWVLRDWDELVDAYGALRWNSEQDDPAHEGLGATEPSVVALEHAVEAVLASCHDGMRPPAARWMARARRRRGVGGSPSPGGGGLGP